MFRGTPAEVSYVVAISLLVHCLFALQPVSGVNPGSLLERYLGCEGSVNWIACLQEHRLQHIVSSALFYFLVSAAIGFCIGYLLGRAVQRWHIKFFIKHGWMLELVGGGGGIIRFDQSPLGWVLEFLKGPKESTVSIYARVVTTPAYAGAGKDGDAAVVIEGTIRDCFFAGDGTLLYLVFTSFKEKIVKVGADPLLDGAPLMASSGGTGRLVLEGRHVCLVRYERLSTTAVTGRDALDRLALAVEQEPIDGSNK